MSRNVQTSIQNPIQWVPMFLLLWIKWPKHEGDHSLPCTKATYACSCTCTTLYVFMKPTEHLDMRTLVTNFHRFMTVEVDSYNLRKFRIQSTGVDCLDPLYYNFIILKRQSTS